MLGEISGGLRSLQAAMTITRGLHALHEQVAINDAKIALQQNILDAQTALTEAQGKHSELTERVRQLEQQLADIAAWKSEADRYTLTAFPAGTYAYVLKPDASNGEPLHRLCPECFQERRKAILQTTAKHSGGEMVDCLRCKNRIVLADFKPEPIEYDRHSSYY